MTPSNIAETAKATQESNSITYASLKVKSAPPQPPGGLKDWKSSTTAAAVTLFPSEDNFSRQVSYSGGGQQSRDTEESTDSQGPTNENNPHASSDDDTNRISAERISLKKLNLLARMQHFTGELKSEYEEEQQKLIQIKQSSEEKTYFTNTQSVSTPAFMLSLQQQVSDEEDDLIQQNNSHHIHKINTNNSNNNNSSNHLPHFYHLPPAESRQQQQQNKPKQQLPQPQQQQQQQQQYTTEQCDLSQDQASNSSENATTQLEALEQERDRIQRMILEKQKKLQLHFTGGEEETFSISKNHKGKLIMASPSSQAESETPSSIHATQMAAAIAITSQNPQISLPAQEQIPSQTLPKKKKTKHHPQQPSAAATTTTELTEKDSSAIRKQPRSTRIKTQASVSQVPTNPIPQMKTDSSSFEPTPNKSTPINKKKSNSNSIQNNQIPDYDKNYYFELHDSDIVTPGQSSSSSGRSRATTSTVGGIASTPQSQSIEPQQQIFKLDQSHLTLQQQYQQQQQQHAATTTTITAAASIQSTTTTTVELESMAIRISQLEQTNAQLLARCEAAEELRASEERINALAQSIEDMEIAKSLATQFQCKNLREAYDRIQELLSQDRQEKRFITCILDMMANCNPNIVTSETRSANLKQAWKWLKIIMEDYMLLKSNANLNSTAPATSVPSSSSSLPDSRGLYKSCIIDSTSSSQSQSSSTSLAQQHQQQQQLQKQQQSSSQSQQMQTNGQASGYSDALVLNEINALLHAENKYESVQLVNDIIKENDLCRKQIAYYQKKMSAEKTSTTTAAISVHSPDARHGSITQLSKTPTQQQPSQSSQHSKMLSENRNGHHSGALRSPNSRSQITTEPTISSSGITYQNQNERNAFLHQQQRQQLNLQYSSNNPSNNSNGNYPSVPARTPQEIQLGQQQQQNQQQQQQFIQTSSSSASSSSSSKTPSVHSIAQIQQQMHSQQLQQQQQQINQISTASSKMPFEKYPTKQQGIPHEQQRIKVATNSNHASNQQPSSTFVSSPSLAASATIHPQQYFTNPNPFLHLGQK